MVHQISKEIVIFLDLLMITKKIFFWKGGSQIYVGIIYIVKFIL